MTSESTHCPCPIPPINAISLWKSSRSCAAGFEALWAGGCVRDQLLGLVPKDYDVATSATPDQIRDLFGHRRTLPIGAAFGVITVLGPRAAGQIEVATFRTDATYSDGRHPDSVTFTDAEHDAQRRDFTINGLFFDPVAEASRRLRRRPGGPETPHVIRAIGDPRLRLREDKLRMLRAVRFAATFDFEIEPDTFHAIQEMAAEITSVSAERIGMEIRRMLVDNNRADALRLCARPTCLPHVLPEVAGLSPARSTTRCASSCASRAVSAAGTGGDADQCSANGKYWVRSTEYQVGSGSCRFLNQPLAPGPQSAAHAVGRRLRYTNKETDRAAWLLGNHAAIAVAPQSDWPRLQRLLINEGATDLLALHKAMAGPARSRAPILQRATGLAAGAAQPRTVGQRRGPDRSRPRARPRIRRTARANPRCSAQRRNPHLRRGAQHSVDRLR